MDLAELIAPEDVVFGARAKNKGQLLNDLASRAAVSLNIEPKTIFDALQAREQLGSTGLGDGFALPHARIERLDRFFACSPVSAGRSISTRSMASPSI